MDEQQKTNMNSENKNPTPQQWLEELSLIKASIRSTQSLMRRMPLADGMKNVLLLMGLLLLTFCGLKYLLEIRYGSADAIPEYFNTLLMALLIVCALGIGVLKIHNLFSLAKADNAQINMGEFLQEIYTRPFVTICMPSLFLFIALPVYFSWIGLPELIVPVLGMLIGLLFFGMVALFDLRAFIPGSIWMLATSYGLLYVQQHNLYIDIILIFSLPLLIMYGSIALSSRKKAGGTP